MLQFLLLSTALLPSPFLLRSLLNTRAYRSNWRHWANWPHRRTWANWSHRTTRNSGGTGARRATWFNRADWTDWTKRTNRSYRAIWTDWAEWANRSHCSVNICTTRKMP